jgi:nucleotide-binding universal stress UspA family protein
MKVRHILLTTDLSEESLAACTPAAEFARSSGAKVTLLHVVHALHMVPYGAPMSPPIAPLDIAQEIQSAEKAIAGERKRFGPGVEVATAVVSADRVHEAIVEYAKANAVDVIAIATHGRTGFRHFALGSVAEAVLRHSPIPVIVFPRRAAK